MALMATAVLLVSISPYVLTQGIDKNDLSATLNCEDGNTLETLKQPQSPLEPASQLEISCPTRYVSNYADSLRKLNFDVKAIQSLQLNVPAFAELKADYFKGLLLRKLLIKSPHYLYEINGGTEYFNASEAVKSGKGQYKELTCLYRKEIDALYSSLKLPGHSTDLTLKECPAPMLSYVSKLSELHIDTSSLASLTLYNALTAGEVEASHFDGLSLKKLRIQTPNMLFLMQNETHLSSNVKIWLTCAEGAEITDLHATLPIRFISQITIVGCLLPLESFASTFEILGINASTISELNLQSSKPQFLSTSTFKRLALRTLRVRGVIDDSKARFLEPLTTLLELDLHTTILSPMPAATNLVNVKLTKGESSGKWGGCSKLKRLQVKDWKIPSQLDRGWLSNCSQLQELTLDELTLQNVETALLGVTSLETLVIHKCHTLNHLSEDFLANATSLRYLDLSNNSLTTIHRNAFRSLTELKHLYISNNRLAHIVPAIQSLGALRTLVLDHNDRLDFCAGPVHTPLSLERLSLQWTATSDLCFGSWRSLAYLNISYSKLTQLQISEIPSARAHALNLDLSHNAIARLVDGHHGNKGSRFEQLVDLSNNAVTRADEMGAAALFAVTTRRLRFVGNPVLCDCPNQPLLAALHENQERVEDFKIIKCAVDGRLLQDVIPSELCGEIFSMRLLAALLTVLVVAIVTTIFLYFKNAPRLKQFLYTRGCCLPCLREAEIDIERQYDAFVSFCHEDDSFVDDHLLPGLKDYNLCVHYKNWIAGEWISVQIGRSIEQSRRTIIVLSKNFLRSVWGMYEFRQAHARALQEGRARIIVVLLEDVTSEPELDSELKGYLASHTYIKWGEAYFWEKIRYGLPHRKRMAKPTAIEMGAVSTVQIGSVSTLAEDFGM